MTSQEKPAEGCGCVDSYDDAAMDRSGCKYAAVRAELEKYTTHDHAPCVFCDPLRQQLAEKCAELEKAQELLAAYRTSREQEVESLRNRLAKKCAGLAEREKELACIETVLETMCSRQPGAAANAVREDYPRLAEIVDVAFKQQQERIETLEAALLKIAESLNVCAERTWAEEALAAKREQSQ